ncbi:unnamed protein product [Dovyalis caffra]|uniref:Uncharacterized protein n=1 Tax=Dovyalis caffra TaxID=77055 RepID=A0AAV1QTF6_9ROSI|nr:unnamed protein product [Dovyalis caffra]
MAPLLSRPGFNNMPSLRSDITSSKARHILDPENSGQNMSLACLACHSVESPSHSFRSYSVSSSDNEGRCSAIANCITRKLSLPPPRTNSSFASSSKVTPQPANPSDDDMTGPPRLVRSRAVRRDLVRDWNFDGVVMER